MYRYLTLVPNLCGIIFLRVHTQRVSEPCSFCSTNADFHETLLSVLWDGVVHTSALVRTTASKMFEVRIRDNIIPIEDSLKLFHAIEKKKKKKKHAPHEFKRRAPDIIPPVTHALIVIHLPTNHASSLWEDGQPCCHLPAKGRQWPYRTQSADKEMLWAFRNRCAVVLISHRLSLSRQSTGDKHTPPGNAAHFRHLIKMTSQ